MMVSFTIATKEGYDTPSHQRRRSSLRRLGEQVMTRLEFFGCCRILFRPMDGRPLTSSCGVFVGLFDVEAAKSLRVEGVS